MPASYRIDLRAGVVYSVLEGHVTNEELLAHQERMSADSDFRPTMNHVIDTRGITRVSVTALGLHLLQTYDVGIALLEVVPQSLVHACADAVHIP